MKRLIAVLLISLFSLVLMAGCVKQEQTQAPATEQAPATDTAAAPTDTTQGK